MPRDALDTDESRWPVVVHTTIGIPSDEQVDAFIRRADAIDARGQTYAVVFDNSLAGRVTPYMRARSMEWLRSKGPELGRHCVGTALVFRSAALRFVMSTVMLVSSHPVPHEVCGTLDQAVRWADLQLAMRQRQRRAG